MDRLPAFLDVMTTDELQAEGLDLLDRFAAVLAAMEECERREKQRIHAGLRT